eukprot:951145-Rhodomonas_salina.1
MGVTGGARGGMGVAGGARGGMGVACGARGGMGVACGASNTYTMPTSPSPPRPEPLVTLEARTDATPRIRCRLIPGPP